MKPIGNKILVRKEEATEMKSASGLIISTASKSAYDMLRGTVAYASDGYMTSHGEFVELNVVPGDVIFFMRQHAVELEYNGEKFFLVAESDVIGIDQ